MDNLADCQCLYVDERRSRSLDNDFAHHDTSLGVALVQTAATLPVFLLGLPSGALADSLDRKHYFLTTQLWVAVVSVLLCVMTHWRCQVPGYAN